MADTKISALTASTTPLAGTEVLPIVQSGTTKQVSVANLTAGRSVAMLSANVTNSALTFHNSFFTNTGALAAGRTASVWLGNGTTVFGASDRQWGLNATVDGTGTNANLEINYYNGSTYSTSAVFLPTGDLRVNTGNLVIATPGKGIDFSATSEAAGMTSELLDDYEEGTFTPTISGSSSAGSGTYSVQEGRYTKVGNLVYVTAVMTWSAHTGTGNMRLSGLPFTVLNVVGLEPPLSLQVNDVALTALNVALATFRRGATYAEVLQTPVGGGSLADVPIDTAASIRYAGSFLVA